MRGLESFSQLITTESDENDITVVSHHINQMIWIAQNICAILKQFISEKSKLSKLDIFLQFKVKTTSLMDFPRFTYRGIMLDSARHFLPKSLILDNVDLMEMNKFNVLHWHITDSTSFPYQSSTFPDLR